MDPKSLSECFTRWVTSLLPEDLGGNTVAIDGKTIRSTRKMDCFEKPLHIVSAHVAELGLTFGQETVDGKSNGIPATQRLVRMLKLKGTIVVADALNCQKETARAIREAEADYLLTVKGNHPTLMEEIARHVEDPELRAFMETAKTSEINRDRFEKRTAHVSEDVLWISDRDAWPGLRCFGAIHTDFKGKDRDTDEWHCYMSSRNLTAQELLTHARLEWSVESMHWLLDVHYGEDQCRLRDANAHQVMNIVRKISLNSIREYKNATGTNMSLNSIMLQCARHPSKILEMLSFGKK